MGNSIIERIVEHVLDAKYGDLSPEAIEATKKALVNTVGCGLAGSSSKPAKIAVETVKRWGGNPQSSIMIWGNKVPAHNAAFANSIMARCLELDDVHEAGGGAGGGHISVVSIPACLAIAESCDYPVSGRDFILSVALGSDLAIRLMMASGTRIGWMGEVTAPFGVVASGAAMLHMNREEILNAMGVAYMQCAASAEGGAEGTWGIWLAAGLAASAGIISLEISKRGYQSMRDPLLGTYGLYPLYFRRNFDPSVLFDELGKRYEIVNVSTKPYSSCKLTHHAIHTTLNLLKEHGLRASDIEEINVVTSSYALNMTVYDEKGKVKYAPNSVAEANFSLPFTVAVAVMMGRVFPDVLTEKALRDPEILALARKVKVTGSAEKDQVLKTAVPPADVSIHTKDGKTYSGSEQFVKGHPCNPMSRDECIEMFERCMALSAKSLDGQAVNEFLSMAWSLEHVKDIRSIARMFCVMNQ